MASRRIAVGALAAAASFGWCGAGASPIAPAAGAVANTLAVVAAPTTGTAFAIRSGPGHTVFLTAAHVVGCRGAEPCATNTSVTVYLGGDLRRQRMGRVVKVGHPERTDDLALFVIDEGPLPTVQLGGDVARGAAVAALGYPESTLEALRDRRIEAEADAVLSLGTVQSADGTVLEGNFATHPGDSGGPVFEPVSGRVIGVVHGRAPHDGPYLAVGVKAIAAFTATVLSGDIPAASIPGQTTAAAAMTTSAAVSVPTAAIAGPDGNDPAAVYAYAKSVRRADPGAYVRALRRAAEGGNGFAADDLAHAYSSGEGVDKDRALWYMWRERALVLLKHMSDAGDGAASFALGRYAENNIGVELGGDGYKVAMDYFRQGAEHKNCDSIETIAYLYRNGNFFTPDAVQAAQWYRRGAETGCEKAMYELGKIYETGNGFPKNLQAALRWYDEDAKRGGYGSLDATRLRKAMGLSQ